jgi:ABC transporter DrrB family efflux protein
MTAAEPGLATTGNGVGARLGWALSDALRMAGRNLLRLVRAPDQLVFTLISPVMFTVLFRFVFGGAVQGLPNGSYATYLIPGIAVQTAVFAAGTTGFALADDLQKGFVARLRSLPMARSAVLAGRMLSDLVNSAVQVVVLLAVGFAVGFRTGSWPGLLLGLVLLLGFALSMSVVFAFVGMSVSTVEAVNAITFPVTFPLTFASSAFVPVSTMPGWLQGFAYHQPVSTVVNAVRSLTEPHLGALARQQLFDGESTSSLVLQSLGWALLIIAVFGFLAVRKYRNLSA